MKVIEVMLKEAKKAYDNNEVPIGCVIVKDGKILSKAHNTKQRSYLCTNHAEIIAIQKAEEKTKDWRLDQCEMYVTLEPCKMCKEVIKQSRIKSVHYLLKSNFDNEENKHINYAMMHEDADKMVEYKELLQSYFKSKR